MNAPNNKKPDITIGVITHSLSPFNFQQFLVELAPAIDFYSGDCELVVVNNSGAAAAETTAIEIKHSGIESACKVLLLSSEENNISSGRNLVLKNATHSLVALIDDDEFPVPHWLNHLVLAMQTYQSHIVAGPTLPLYLFDTPKWITNIDLHRAKGKTTGQQLKVCPSCNVLIDKSRIMGEYFKPAFGRSGGEDTEFFMRQVNNGLKLVWSKEAATYEYIPQAKSTIRYAIKRAVLQGQLNRRILTGRGDIKNQILFSLRSITLVIASLVIAPCLLLIGHETAGDWIRRGFANLGHLTALSATLYPE